MDSIRPGEDGRAFDRRAGLAAPPRLSRILSRDVVLQLENFNALCADDVVDQIAEVAVNERDKPREQIVMEKVTVE